MKKIDEDLGGTTPLNIIIKFPKKEKTFNNNNESDELDDWEDNNDQENKAKYWFTETRWTKL